MNKPLGLWVTAGVLLACLSIGFWKASHRPLWNDEIYSLVSSTHHTSLAQMVMGRIGEGNNAPAFYALQKFLILSTGYKIPVQWIAGDWGHKDPVAQILLRVIPVVSVSLSIALIFYFFLCRFSWPAAALSAWIALSSYMLWAYWAEARPYALVILLSTLQSLILMEMLRRKAWGGRWWLLLAGVHWAYAFTFILSAVNIAAASLIVYCVGLRDLRKFVLITVLPLAAIGFYYWHAPKLPFWFDFSIEQLIRDNISRDRFYIFMAFVTVLILNVWNVRGAWSDVWQSECGRAFPYMAFVLLTVAMTIGLIAYWMAHAAAPGQGFPVNSRYFIYLTAPGIIAATAGCIGMYRNLSFSRWGQWILILAAGYFLVHRFFKIVPDAVRSVMGG